MSSLCRLLHRRYSTAGSVQTNKETSSIKAISHDLWKERDLRRLVDKFKKSSEIERFRTRTGIYQDTVRRLASAKRFNWIHEIIEDQKKYRDISKEGFSVRLITLYGKSMMFEHAQKLFDEMPDRNAQRTVLSFNALLAACVNSQKHDLIDGLFKELPGKLSIKPDLVSYNTVIKGFCDMGNFDSAMKMFDELEKKGLKPDLITFNTLLHGLYGNGQFSDGEKLWDQMAEKNVVPDIRSYNARLMGLAAGKKTEAAVELVQVMRSKGIKPDIFSFNALIKGSVNEGNLEEAKRWYGEIKSSEFDPNKGTFATLIPFLCEKGDLKTAYEVGNDVFVSECLLDMSLMQLLVDKLVESSLMDEAKKLVHCGKTNRYRRMKLKLPEVEVACD